MKTAKRLSITVFILISGCATPALYRVSPAEMADASTIAPFLMKSGDLRLGVFLESVDGKPVASGSFLGPRVQTTETQVASGERQLTVQVFFVKLGFKNVLLARSGPFIADVPIKFRVEPKHKYQMKGELRDKECAAWIVDSTTGDRLKVEESSAPFRSMHEPDPLGDLMSRGIVEGAARAVFR